MNIRSKLDVLSYFVPPQKDSSWTIGFIQGVWRLSIPAIQESAAGGLQGVSLFNRCRSLLSIRLKVKTNKNILSIVIKNN